MNRQIRQLGAALVVLFLILFAQLNNTQVVRAQSLADHPRNNRNAVATFSSPRGSIQTADGVVIAKSVPVDDQYKQLRQYPEGELFGPITGFFSFNYGSEGLEKTYNDDLAGKRFALKNIGDLVTDRVKANNVTTSITERLQQTAKEGLGDRRGAVVALDPKTGAILAMYSNPSYNPEPLASHDFDAVKNARADLVSAAGNPMLPRAFRESYARGSTMKVVTSAAAYERKPELTTRRYPTLQLIALPQSTRTLSNFNRELCGGQIADLLRVSCNTGFAQIGMDLGGPALLDEAQDFGFDNRPPLDLPSPAASRYPGLDKLRYAPNRAYSAIGQQDVSATPLQMALVASAIANKGVIMEPTVMKEIRDSRGDIVRKADYKPWRRATSPAVAENVKNLMLGVAARGTATNAQIPGVQVAAKTGTAETTENHVHAWLISFAPANDPKIAVAVILENQTGSSDTTGGLLAAPIAKKMMQTALGIQ